MSSAEQTPPRRRRWPLITLAVLAVGAVGVTGVLVFGKPDSAEAAKGNQPSAVKTTPVRRMTLMQQEKVDGKLGYSGAHDVSAAGGGVYTWLPDVGQVIKRGDRLYSANGKDVPLWYGKTPLWRKLESGMDDGPDVRVVEENLRALGYKGFTVDDKFNDGTAAAIKKWQKDRKLEQTGVLEPGAVVIAAGELRVAKVDAGLGAPAQGKLLSGTDTGRIVTVDMPVAKQALAKVGAAVDVGLPGGGKAKGKVTSVGTVATKPESNGPGGGGDDKATIKVEVALDEPTAAGKLDGAPVSVYFTSERKENVLTVPVNSLLALAEGGYAVEVAFDDGTSKLVGVELGMFANGNVEVTSAGLVEGSKIKVAGT